MHNQIKQLIKTILIIAECFLLTLFLVQTKFFKQSCDMIFVLPETLVWKLET